ncbi:glycosyltransferase [Fischerella sp. PCC 9605]|uniref:glycosyltransferase n=1 Tax=Fischerella sp. PCC 9605 TaxID=1173024 RepID=UPI00047DB493|nr:glycosyltransferase [Fischerella sp. PCC 9605]
MEKIANNILSLMHEEGLRLIQKRFQVFSSLVAQAKYLTECGKYEAGAVYAEIAAFYATYQHCGLFVSPDLEQVLLAIGQKAIQTNFTPIKNTSLSGTPSNVLHVITGAPCIGGHSKMLCRWIQQDRERSHSLVVTRQTLVDVAPFLKEAVFKSQGKIYALKESIGSVISWATKLREIATSADVVVLHTHQEDVIPTIAFANKDQSPPVIYVNQADQCFWQGIGISDVIANLRESGMQLSLERRNIAAERNLLLPIVLNPAHRTLSRVEAKRQLDIPDNSVLLLSIARAHKYKTIDGISFADVHLPLMQKYNHAILIVIGSDNSEDWSSAIQQTEGRIKVFAERADTSVFYQAADIYVDTFPIISNTSLLEAGSYGVPVVSRYPFSDTCRIIGADAPGLDGKLLRARNLEEYIKILSSLIDDEELRLSLGEATKRQIEEIHIGSNWQLWLENLYLRAVSLPRVTMTSAVPQGMFLGETDGLLSGIFCKKDIDIDVIIQSRMRMMPLEQRWQNWIKLIKMQDLSHFGSFKLFTLLLPEWFYLRMKKLLSYR